MKSILITAILLSVFTTIYAQKKVDNNGNFKVSGKVVDLVSKQAIEYATISLINDSTKKIVNGGITDKKGFFSLQKLKRGNYTITIQFISYADFTKKVFISDDVVLEDILLDKKSSSLENVTVTGRRQTIENKIDKLVYNVEKDITSQGGVATDVLKKIPGITVDIDGNVELLGNPSIRFLIDGKPSAIFGNSVADALQSIPNSQIQNIEVITTPSAKYEASGTGGIINIILKKSNIEGFNGNVSLAAGSRLENGSLNSSFKHGNLGLSAYFSGNAQLTSSSPNGFNRITSTNKNRLLQESITDINRNGYKGGMSMDLALSKRESLTASVGFDHFGFNNLGNTNQQSILYDISGMELSNIATTRNADSKLNVTDFENSLSFKRKFKKDGEELEFSYGGSFGNNTTSYNQLQYYPGNNNAFAGSNSLNPGKENELNFAVNYAYPLKKDVILETGFKTTLQKIISNADVFTLNGSSGTFSRDSMQSYTSDYRRTVYAGYASINYSLFDFLDIISGIRYEYTISKADYSNAHNVAIPDYSNLAPSLIIGHNFPNNQMLKLAYSYRIERPDFRDLNPFMNLADPHNITTGNPNLQPEIGNKIELGYNKSYSSGANINIIVYYQRNSPDIKPYITYYSSYKIGDSVYNDVTLTTRATIAAEVRAGVNLSGSLPVTKKMTVRPNFQIFNRHLNNINATPAITNAFGVRLNMNISYQFSKNIAAEVFGNYNSGMHWQGKQASVYSYTMAIRKQFNNNKGSLGIIVVNPFNKYVNQKSQQLTQDFTSDIYRDVPYRSFGISFTYKFGKLKFSKPKESENYLYAPPPSDN